MLVGLACWFRSGLRKTMTVWLDPDLCEQFGITPNVRKRGLRRLSDANLILWEKRQGRFPLVTLYRSPFTDAFEEPRDE